MAYQPVIIGSVYLTNGIARMKLNISYAGSPLLGQFPTVTIVRDSDNRALDFTTDTFVNVTTPSDLGQAKFKHIMTELGVGSYYWDYNPATYGQTGELVYTVIFVNTHPVFGAVTSDEFMMSDRLDIPRFGIIDRPKEVCLNEETLIEYQAQINQTDVMINIYDPFDNLIVANATMGELENTGIYRYRHIFTLDGEYTVICGELTSGTTDAQIIVAGRACDRLKRIEQMLSDLLQNRPTVTPC